MKPATASTHSVRRVALTAAGVALALYALVGVLADVVVAGRLSNEANDRLTDRLSDIRVDYARSDGKVRPAAGALSGGDLDDAPVVAWFVRHGAQSAMPLDRSAPPLPAVDFSVTRIVGRPIGDRAFRVAGETVRGGRLIAATSTRSERSALTTLIAIEFVLAPFAFAGVLGSAWLIGRRAADPVERAHRQQQAFTADASHELRTPLTVIEAELGLALSRERTATSYRETLHRVSGESRRLRSLVEELLWLSRVDAAPHRPRDELVDLAVIAKGCVDRFGGVAEARGVDLVLTDGPDTALLRAPADWLDQLGGVLLDNACKYAGEGGTVRLAVTDHGSSVGLAVEDSGPGVDDADRERIFERFHRGEQREVGAGLGLAIADAVVRATGGRWAVGRSALGGARFAVTWSASGRFQLGLR